MLWLQNMLLFQVDALDKSGIVISYSCLLSAVISIKSSESTRTFILLNSTFNRKLSVLLSLASALRETKPSGSVTEKCSELFYCGLWAYSNNFLQPLPSVSTLSYFLRELSEWISLTSFCQSCSPVARLPSWRRPVSRAQRMPATAAAPR